VARESRKGDDVTDVFHTCDEEDESFKAGVKDGAIFSDLEILPILNFLQADYFE